MLSKRKRLNASHKRVMQNPSQFKPPMPEKIHQTLPFLVQAIAAGIIDAFNHFIPEMSYPIPHSRHRILHLTSCRPASPHKWHRPSRSKTVGMRKSPFASPNVNKKTISCAM